MTHAGVTPALAATVVLLRPGRTGLEVLLTRRPTSMAFAPDMHVFPGGRVDAADGDPRLVARSVLSPSDAAAGLGGDLPPDVAIATYIAAIREVFEESGVLLADTATTHARGKDARAISMARSALVGGDADLATIAAELDLTLRTDLLVPLSRWVTPPILPRRFDARFFAAALPTGARVTFEGDEVAGHAWMTPAAALDCDVGRPACDVDPDERHASATHTSRIDRGDPGSPGSRSSGRTVRRGHLARGDPRS